MNLAELQSKTSEQLLALLNELEPEARGPAPESTRRLLYEVLIAWAESQGHQLAQRRPGSAT